MKLREKHKEIYVGGRGNLKTVRKMGFNKQGNMGKCEQEKVRGSGLE